MPAHLRLAGRRRRTRGIPRSIGTRLREEAAVIPSKASGCCNLENMRHSARAEKLSKPSLAKPIPAGLHVRPWFVARYGPEQNPANRRTRPLSVRGAGEIDRSREAKAAPAMRKLPTSGLRMPVLWKSPLGLSRQRETTGVWTLSLRCLRAVVSEVLEKAYEVCRCASNCIQVDGAASKCSNGA
jgi:hypothetical protein